MGLCVTCKKNRASVLKEGRWYCHMCYRLPPVSRDTDPEVAKRAEVLLNRSGRRLRTLDRIYDRLLAGPATNLELAEVTPRYGARIYDLRELGCVIHSETFLDGTSRYVLDKHIGRPG